MAGVRTRPAGLLSAGFQTFSLSNSTAQSLNSTTKQGNAFDISVETQSVRMRCDGTAPTLTTGVLFATGRYRIEMDGTSNIKFQRSTGTCKVSIQAWKYPGD